MDADLQDPPEVVVRMLERYREGYDIAYAQRTKRHGETAFKLRDRVRLLLDDAPVRPRGPAAQFERLPPDVA